MCRIQMEWGWSRVHTERCVRRWFAAIRRTGVTHDDALSVAREEWRLDLGLQLPLAVHVSDLHELVDRGHAAVELLCTNNGTNTPDTHTHA
jgi:hypothetical protein